jgi:hypothetical protein
LLVGFGYVGNMDRAASLIKLADDLRELLSHSAGQNDGRTLIPKASGCYGAHAGTGAGHDDQLAFESLETQTFLFRTECSDLFAVLLKKIGGRRREPGTHFHRYGGALV